MKQRDYDSTVARIAGNILGHLLTRETNIGINQTYAFHPGQSEIQAAVATARAIVAEVKRTEPQPNAGYTRTEPPNQ